MHQFYNVFDSDFENRISNEDFRYVDQSEACMRSTGTAFAMEPHDCADRLPFICVHRTGQLNTNCGQFQQRSVVVDQLGPSAQCAGSL